MSAAYTVIFTFNTRSTAIDLELFTAQDSFDPCMQVGPLFTVSKLNSLDRKSLFVKDCVYIRYTTFQNTDNYGIIYTTALTLLLLTLVVSLTSAKPLTLSLSAHEGDRVFIPCFNTPEARIFFWKINGSLYAVEELPTEMYLRKTSNGILVHRTTLSINSDFTCFTFEGRTTLREISTVHFVVQARGLSSEPGNAK